MGIAMTPVESGYSPRLLFFPKPTAARAIGRLNHFHFRTVTGT